MYDDIPEEIIHDENVKYAVTGVQSNSVLGTIESLKGITRERFLKYFNEQYVASNLVISVAGKVDVDEIYNLLNKGLGKFRGSSFRRDIDTSFTINGGENIIKKDTNQVHLCFNTRGNGVKDDMKYPGASSFRRDIDTSFTINGGENIIKKDTNQVHLCFNTRGNGVKDDMKYPGAIISSVLGGNMSSRLFQKIREERGLAYSVYSYGTAFLEGGLFTIYAGTTKESYKEVLEIGNMSSRLFQKIREERGLAYSVYSYGTAFLEGGLFTIYAGNTKESYKEVLEIIKNDFNDIRENGISEPELQKSKNQFLSMLTFSLESSKGKMSRMANSYLLYDEVIDIHIQY